MSDAGALDRQLRFAIEHKRSIEVAYDGRRRVAEPHDDGVKNGSARPLVYQLYARGEGRDMRAPGWRLLDVAKIGFCAVSDTTFAGSRADDSQRHFTWDEIFARVG